MEPAGTRLHPTGRPIPAGLDEAMIAAVVQQFYFKARQDPVIGPVFNAVIAEADWPRHLSVIGDFWSSMLLGSGRYAGRPMPKHVGIPGLSDRHFARWLQLFRETVEDLCSEEAAALFVERAERVAHSFRIGIAIHRDGDGKTVELLRAPARDARG
jgi:hemoglobin